MKNPLETFILGKPEDDDPKKSQRLRRAGGAESFRTLASGARNQMRGMPRGETTRDLIDGAGELSPTEAKLLGLFTMMAEAERPGGKLGRLRLPDILEGDQPRGEQHQPDQVEVADAPEPVELEEQRNREERRQIEPGRKPNRIILKENLAHARVGRMRGPSPTP